VSLSDQLKTLKPFSSYRGCRTCLWLDSLPAADRKAFDAWVAENKSITQLWQACVHDPDHPLVITHTPFRDHIRHHQPL